MNVRKHWIAYYRDVRFARKNFRSRQAVAEENLQVAIQQHQAAIQRAYRTLANDLDAARANVMHFKLGVARQVAEQFARFVGG